MQSPLPLDVPVFEHKVPSGPKGQRDDRSTGVELWFVVLMVTHAILAVVVAINQHEVERAAN